MLNSSPADGIFDLSRTPVQDTDAQHQSQRLSEESLLPPGHVPGYEIEQLLGEGAYGSVWLARELKTGKQVAIKFYTQRRGLNWSLLSREVEKLAVLYTSRNIVGLLDVGWDHDPPYFVMEYLESGSLDQRLKEGRIPVEDAVRIATAIARALVHAHRSGILHCDLKPANVLLDANAEPRLGDFGQSRLTTEQSPSFGTLFFMAPEQAVVDGVPDVRWDVYALGALLYHMLTGTPPYASPAAEQKLGAARSLPMRLAVYRQLIADSPPPDLHRSLPGVDHHLADLIDGCLQREPGQRIPSVQRVLDLLEARDKSRSRRSLVALGFLGPILFLLATYWIAESAVPRVVAAAEQNLIDRALAGDGVSARILAESVQQDLRSREALLSRLAESPEVLDLLQTSKSLTDAELFSLCQGVPDAPDEAREVFDGMRQTVAEAQEHLQVDGRTADESWFITDDQGRQVFRSPPRDPNRETTLGRLFFWRDYFHGQGHELEPSIPRSQVAPRSAAGISAPFRSQATDQYMVAIAVPIRRHDQGPVLGILARTIGLPALLQQWEVRLRESDSMPPLAADQPARFLVLADARGDELRLLDHPGMTQQRLSALSDADLEHKLTVAASEATVLRSRHQSDHYQDPLAAFDERFAGEWLAASAPVGETGWMAIVQERREMTVQPVDNLRRVFLRAGFWSLGIFSALLLLLWYLIHRATA
ncbi:MAG: serine/threonine protein kinase [Planctomycetaceae bacterium]